MRPIITERLGPKLVFSNKGTLVEVSTGSNFFYEHNVPVHYLGPVVCDENLRIIKWKGFQFLTISAYDNNPAEAVLGYSSNALLLKKHLLESMDFYNDISSALNEGNFVVRVRGESNISALTVFYNELLAGNVELVPDTAKENIDRGLILRLIESTEAP